MNPKAYLQPMLRYALKFRKDRFQLFLAMIRPFGDRALRVLDVGGREQFWIDMGFDLTKHKLTILNTEEELKPPAFANVETVVGDGCNMPQFGRGDFDLVFSNSVIEHVGRYEDQRRMATEVRRIADVYFVQTPNFFFPLEPHFHVPAFQMLPLGVRTALIQRFALGCMPRVRDRAEAQRLAEDTRLIRRGEMVTFFPDAEIHAERLLGMTKSWIALKRPAS